MYNNSKEKMTRDIICKSHSARTERDLYRICPSKLSKRELEDLYFALLEKNLDLKRTINSQKEKIKELSTKVQRISASQRSTFSKEQRECCLTIKAAYNDQKESIADLKRTNERMAERIRLLNMRLCSARQFLKRSPGQDTSCCTKCSIGPISTPKNLSVTTLNIKASDSKLKSKAVSTQTLDNGAVSIRSVETETCSNKKNEETLRDANISGKIDDVTSLKANSLVRNTLEDRLCEENKCRTLMEELKQKIVNLKLELSHCHEEYGERIGRLESELSSHRADRKRTALLSEQKVTIDGLTTRLREADIHNRELATQLVIERRKVVEMETRLKAAQISARVLDTIEQRLAKNNMENANPPPSFQTINPSSNEEDHSGNVVTKYETREQGACKCSQLGFQTADSVIDASHLSNETINNVNTELGNQSPDSKRANYVGFKLEGSREGQSKNLDDSGYADGTKSNDVEDEKTTCGSSNQELMKKIEHLQAQFQHIKFPNPGSSITPVGRSFVNATDEANLGCCDKLLKIGSAENPVQLKEAAKEPAPLMHETSQQSYPGYHCLGMNTQEADKSLPKKFDEIHVTQEPLEESLEKHFAKSNQDMTTGSVEQIYDKNGSLPTILQQPSLQKRCVDSVKPQQAWDNTWGKYPVVLASTSRGCKEDATIFTGMYSASEQNERDVTSVAGKDMDENKSNEQNNYQIPRPFAIKEQNFSKEHKKSNFKQQSCAKDKNAHIELQTIDETRPQNDHTIGINEIKPGKGKKLSFEDDLVKVSFVKNKPNLLVPSAQSISMKDNNMLKMDSIEINRRRLTRDTSDEKTVAPLKVLKNGKAAAVDSAVVKNDCMTDYCKQVGNTGKGGVVQPEQEVGVNCSEQIITSGLRPLLINRGPVTSQEVLITETEIATSVADYVKLVSVANEDIKKSGNIVQGDKRKRIKGTNEFGVQVSPRPVEQYAPYRRSTVYPETNTYTVQHSTEDKSAGNDRDTDCEISEMTDLPTELDEKSPREYLSPGEEKATSPLSSSQTRATTDFGSLSEGELPGLTIPRRLSEGEKPVGDISPHGKQQTSAEKMETALQAISEELAKCKQLLLHQTKQRKVPAPILK